MIAGWRETSWHARERRIWRAKLYGLTNTRPVAMFLSCIDLNGSDRAPQEQLSTPLFCTKASELYHYVVVRRDLPLGTQLAQACHAAGESPGPKPEPGCTMVVLHAADEQHLHIIRARLDKAGLPYGTVIECPDDEDYPSQLMAIGLAPTTDRTAIKKVLSSLPLAR